MIDMSTMRALLFCGIALFWSGGAISAQCHVPSFRKGEDYGASVFVALSPRDFTLDKLKCLAQTMKKKRHLESKQLYVAFFSSYEAAKYFRPPGAPGYRSQFARQLHATYTFDSEKGAETLDVLPLGLGGDETVDTTITFPQEAPPHCKLNVQDRCLMAVIQEIAYPEQALKEKVSGKIAMTGRITMTGVVTDVQMSDTNVSASPGRSILAAMALQNLQRWQFDASKGDNTIRITYVYVIDSSLPSGIHYDVRWGLPDQIVIRGNPQ